MPAHDSELLQTVKTLVQRFGARIVSDADNFQATLADWVDESDTGRAGLLVDAVRTGALDQLQRSMSVAGSDPAVAVAQASQMLQRQRGGTDAGSAHWAVALLGAGLGIVPEHLIASGPPAGGPPQPPLPVPPHPGPGQGPGPIPNTDETINIPQGGDTAPTPPLPLPIPSRSGISGKVVAIIAGALAVLVGATIALVVVLGGGDDDKDKPKADASPSESAEPERITTDVTTVAKHFAALGNLVSASNCRSEDLQEGFSERVVCSFAGFEVHLAEAIDAETLEIHRAEATKADGTPLLTSTSSNDRASVTQVVYQANGDAPYPDGGTRLYWDSSDSLQSGSVVVDSQKTGAQDLRTWYDNIGGPIAAAPFAGIEPFKNVDLYVFYKRHEYAVDPTTCKASPSSARDYDYLEYVSCDATDGFQYAEFSIAENLREERSGLPKRSNEEDQYALKYDGAYSHFERQTNNGIYRVYLACYKDRCSADNDFYTWGYKDDEDMAGVLNLYSLDGDINTAKMFSQLGLEAGNS